VSPHDEHVDLLRSMSAVWGRDAFVAAVADVLEVTATPPPYDDTLLMSNRVEWVKRYRAVHGGSLKDAVEESRRLLDMLESRVY
jgi:hypothetical protein